MQVIRFRLRPPRTLATIQHNSTPTTLYRSFLDDNLLLDYILTVLQNFSSEFLKFSGSRGCRSRFELLKTLRFRIPPPNLNSTTTKTIQHNTTTTPCFGLMLHCKTLQSSIKGLWLAFLVISRKFSPLRCATSHFFPSFISFGSSLKGNSPRLFSLPHFNLHGLLHSPVVFAF
jgi:hypothetical protein